MTWLARADGYELFFNRDESRARLPAQPPRRLELRGVEVLAPIDADAGGTWLGVNAFGVSVGVLNGRAGTTQPRDPISRGLLVLDMLDATSARAVMQRLEGLDLSRRRAFQLVALDCSGRLWCARWDGASLAIVPREVSAQPLSSSSLDPEGAGANRRRVLDGILERRGALDEAALLEFHASHDPTAGPRSACMHRDDAVTVSFTRTRVTPTAVELGYAAGAPCQGAPLAWIGLERLAPTGDARRQPVAAASPKPGRGRGRSDGRGHESGHDADAPAGAGS